MRNIKPYYDLPNMPEGTHKGSIKGYEVYMDGIDSGFKATTGYRNMYPIPCVVVVKGGQALAYSRHGILFSSEAAQTAWKSKFDDTFTNTLVG
jgi:hypothetical protein